VERPAVYHVESAASIAPWFRTNDDDESVQLHNKSPYPIIYYSLVTLQGVI
jgi:hypothetical protein